MKPGATQMSASAWIKTHEFKHYVARIIWITGTAEYSKELNLLAYRIETLYRKQGPKFTFKLLKEVLRLVILALSGNNIKAPLQKGAPWFKRTKSGLPKILPVGIRAIILNGHLIHDRRIFIAILSLISIFRVIGFKVEPDLSTIVAPFTGSKKSFDILELSLALRNLLGSKSLDIGNIKSFILETSGPNGFRSTWASPLDAIAYRYYPQEFESLRKLMLHLPDGKFYYYWMLLLQALSLPLLKLFAICGLDLNLKLGKLSVVRDQAGKARIVAITNWWLQICLNPIHKALFKLLKGFDQDGTFNQTKPLELLMKYKGPVHYGDNFVMTDSRVFFSFDLSSATDRLPVDVQKDILNILSPSLGDLWLDALSIPWFWKSDRIKYSVGQPMGAYSSWAMLALTHHTIVQLAALRAGLTTKFTEYAVLGDDIVIASEPVAKEYLQIMSDLGVSINLNKSVISNRFAEFAKRWVGPQGLDITPIGPGLTLRFVRDDFYVTTYCVEALKLRLILSLEDVLVMFLGKGGNKFHSLFWEALWSVLGAASVEMNSNQDYALLVEEGMS